LNKTKADIMKKLHILGVAISAALCVPIAAQASDGQIDFKGALNTSTCTVTTPAGTNFSVTLPTLATSSLASANTTAGTTPFSISVGGCTAKTTFTTFFESGTYTDPLTGRLNTLAGGAGNVQLQLLNSDNTVINTAAGPTLQGVRAASVTGTPGVGTANFAVRYFATGPTTAGTVTSAVTYSMTYL
jgi:major type 1 subunit fimbrin (pilin)